MSKLALYLLIALCVFWAFAWAIIEACPGL